MSSNDLYGYTFDDLTICVTNLHFFNLPFVLNITQVSFCKYIIFAITAYNIRNWLGLVQGAILGPLKTFVRSEACHLTSYY